MTYEGKPFSFTIDIATEWIKYERRSTDLFPKLWKRRDTTRSKNEDSFRKAIMELPSEITCSSQYRCFCDERQTKFDGFAHVENGYTVTVNVSEAYATENYKHYAMTALPFRDKLLSNYKELIKEIVGERGYCFVSKEFNFKQGSLESYFERFYVTPIGVGSSSILNDADSHGNLFADFGMCNLNNISECYGFALAIIEIYRREWEKYGTPNIEIGIEDRFGVGSIVVKYKVVREKSPLKSW